MTPPLPSGERPALRAIAPPVLTAVALAAIAVVAAVLLAPATARAPLAWGLGTAAVLLCAAVAVAARSVRAARLLRGRLESVTQDTGRLLHERARQAEEFGQERARLADEAARDRVHAAENADRERTRLTEDAARERDRLTAEFTAERDRLTAEFTAERDRLAEESAAERDRFAADRARLTARNAELDTRARQAAGERAAAISATANAAGRMQALSTGMLADLRAMEEKHSDEDVLADLLHLDHRTAQAGRLADSVAVLAGARSGRRWARPIVMESILRGAMGRIGGYQRVRVHSASEAAVAGHAAEGVMHALAELLDNAATFSPPTAEVHVYVEEVPAGVIVSVEDSGLVMGDVQLRRAERAVSGEAADTGGLGGLTGTRLGLAVVGRLARKHGLKVSFRPSARGGTGVLVLIPQDLLTPPSTVPGTAPDATPGTTPEAGTAATPAPAAVAGHTSAPGTRAHREPEAQHGPGERRETAGPDGGDDDRASRPAEDSPTAPVSYAAGRAAGDLDPDPVPAHDSPRHEPGPSATGGLPKRRRGRTLAHAERSRSHTTPQPAPEARGGEDPRTRSAARFGSFRQAVRGAAPDAPEAVRAEEAQGEEPARARAEEQVPGQRTAPAADRARGTDGTDVPRGEAGAQGAPPAPLSTNTPTQHALPEGDTTS
ncbi:ATP-binding protein [Streptomyces sp. NBC_00687]|uniref:ATP-binding protein n=1 Tax=Streptomyces sp. NBC_00687 TaxID=2975807 RepID=UPI002254C615|nr:ATP-binding protein [Streptomyces sp. NBC_00687]MCX4915422.1 ATP-binding protein [Streptomyces sp. NBC_00687]